MKLETEEFRVKAENQWLRFSTPILQAISLGEKIFVIFDYMRYPQGRPAQNLAAFDKNGKELWKAKNPTSAGNDAYVNFISYDDLVVGNFAGYKCRVDQNTGDIIDAQFTK